MEKERDLKNMEVASACAAKQIRDMLNYEDVATLTELQVLMYVPQVWSVVGLIQRPGGRILVTGATNRGRNERGSRPLVRSYGLPRRVLPSDEHESLGRLQDSNAVLSHFNDFSERSFAAVANDFSKNTRLLRSMKGDLDHIFKRIRGLKNKLAAQYPDAFNESLVGQIIDQRPDLETEIGWKQ